jgi:hypothetical protein
MQDIWYADNRDLIKWSVLLHLVRKYNAKKIVQIAYYRKSDFKTFEIDGVNQNIPEEILNHFRRIKDIETLNLEVPVHVFDTVIADRKVYLSASLRFIQRFQDSNTVVFLDPDTGLEPKRHGLQHVLESEAKTIYDNLMKGDVFAFYQHQTNLNGKQFKNSIWPICRTRCGFLLLHKAPTSHLSGTGKGRGFFGHHHLAEF